MALVVASVATLGAAAASGAAVGAACSMQKLMLKELRGRAAAVEEVPRQPAEPRRLSTTAAAGLTDAQMAAGWQGFSMEEARQHADVGHEAAIARTPSDVLADLQRGNTRFWMGAATRPEKSAFERRALINKQFPSVAILGCSDSRVPTEIVFDQGLGDIFVVRVAGNCLSTATTGSLQYAVNHLKVKVLMVMGHEACGAIKASGLPVSKIEQEPEALCTCLKTLGGGLDFERLGNIKDTRAHDREAVISNVIQQVEGLKKDKGMMQKVEAGELIIVGAFYEISSGIVDFFHKVA